MDKMYKIIRDNLNQALAKINDMENVGFHKYGSNYKSSDLDVIANHISKAKEALLSHKLNE